MKEVFFADHGVALPWDFCEALIRSTDEPALGYLELIHARGRARAAISDQQLRNICIQMNDGRLWTSLAWLDECSCRWVIETCPFASDDVKRAALHHIPDQITPSLLGQDFRLVEEWCRNGWEDAFQRRQLIFNAAKSALKRGELATAFPAIDLSLELDYHNTDSDPADPSRIYFQHGLIPLTDARDVFTLWERLLSELKQFAPFAWGNVVGIVEHWAHADARSGVSVPDEYRLFLHASTFRMIDSLKPLAGQNQAALRWLNLCGRNQGFSVDLPAADTDFMVLFPEEGAHGDWRSAEERQTRAAQELALRWKDHNFADLVERLALWQQQVEALGRVGPQMLPVFARELANLKTLSASELSVALAKLPARAAGAFLDNAITQRAITSKHLQEALIRPELHGILIDYTLSGRTPALYPQLVRELPNWEALVESLCIRGDVSVEMLENLFQHENDHLRREVAFYAMRAKDGVPDSVRPAWRKVVIESLVKIACGDDEPPDDLWTVLSTDPTVAPEVLEGVIARSASFRGFQRRGVLARLTEPLSKDERRSILHRIKGQAHSALFQVLVDHDAELYQEMISIPEFAGMYTKALVGDPNVGNWTLLAKIALAAGHSHRDISHAVDSEGYSWSGRLSAYYQEWVDRFQRLRRDPDPDIQRVADEGIRWSSAERDAHLQAEKKEAIYGWD